MIKTIKSAAIPKGTVVGVNGDRDLAVINKRTASQVYEITFTAGPYKGKTMEVGRHAMLLKSPADGKWYEANSSWGRMIATELAKKAKENNG